MSSMTTSVTKHVTNIPPTKISTDNQINISHRTRKRIREAKKKARPGKNLLLIISGSVCNKSGRKSRFTFQSTELFNYSIFNMLQN